MAWLCDANPHRATCRLFPGCPRAAPTVTQGFRHPATSAAAVTSDIQETPSALLLAESELWVIQKGDTKSPHNHFKPSPWSQASLARESGREVVEQEGPWQWDAQLLQDISRVMMTLI